MLRLVLRLLLVLAQAAAWLLAAAWRVGLALAQERRELAAGRAVARRLEPPRPWRLLRGPRAIFRPKRLRVF